MPIIYDEITKGFSEGLAAAKLGGKWGFINRKNEAVIPFAYDWVPPYDSGFKNGLSVVTDGELIFFIDSKGQEFRGE